MNRKYNMRPIYSVFFGIFCIMLISCGRKIPEGSVIMVQVDGKGQDSGISHDDPYRTTGPSRIVAAVPGNKSPLRILTKDFYSACSPEISFDGKYMLFSARQTKDDPWQIWETDLQNLKTKKIISLKENCLDPAYLPGGRLVFSKYTMNDTVLKAYALYSCMHDGSMLKQVTYDPDNYLATTVLKDGRLLSLNTCLYPDYKDPVFTVMRPDGTKTELFYMGPSGSYLRGRVCETTGENIIFAESVNDKADGGKLISIKYNRPLFTRVDLTQGIKGEFLAPYALQSGKLLVSHRPDSVERFGLYEFDPVKKAVGRAVFKDSGYDVLDAVIVEKHERPRKLPSEVDAGVKTGLLLCQDINISRNNAGLNKEKKIEIMGIDSTMGIVNVEEDGSFYLKIMADRPFQLRTLDDKGNIRQTCAWIWLRSNERRGCVGCHEDPERVPENRVSLAVKKSPVVLPVHMKSIHEKEVALE